MAKPAILKVLDLQRAQLRGLVELRGVKRLRGIYETSRAELEQRLASLRRRGMGQSFSAHHARTMLIQVNQALLDFQGKLGAHLTANGKIAGQLGQRHLINSIKKLEKKFSGHAPVLQAEQAAVLQRVFSKTQPALLNRYKKSERLYGRPVVKKIREQLALSLAQGQTVDEAVDRVAGVGGVFDGQRWRAERIVRTELSYTYGVVQYRQMQEVRKELPDLERKLIATFDDRTGADSKELHGQVQPMGEPFVWEKPNGERVEYMMPPNRPNDREVVIPWRPAWADSAVTEPGGEGPGDVSPRDPV